MQDGGTRAGVAGWASLKGGGEVGLRYLPRQSSQAITGRKVSMDLLFGLFHSIHPTPANSRR